MKLNSRSVAFIAHGWSILPLRLLGEMAVPSLADKIKKHVTPVTVIFTAVGIVAGLVTGAIGAYQYFVRDLPELKAGIQAIQKDIRDMEGRNRTSLDTHIAQEQVSRDRTENAMRVVKSYVVSLIQKVEHRQLKPAELKELVSNVGYVSKIEAVNFAGHTVVTGPQLPAFPSTVMSMIQKGVFTGEESLVFGYKSPQGDKPTLTKSIAAALLQKDGKWEATDNGVKFLYGGGSSIFTAKQSVSKFELLKTVDLFNSMSQAVSLTELGDSKAPKLSR